MSLRNPGQEGRVYPEMTFNPANTRAWTTQKGRILIEMEREHPLGWLAREMSHEIGISPNQTNTRMGELRTMSLIEPTGRERRTETGNMAHEFRLSSEGLTMVHEFFGSRRRRVRIIAG